MGSSSCPSIHGGAIIAVLVLAAQTSIFTSAFAPQQSIIVNGHRGIQRLHSSNSRLNVVTIPPSDYLSGVDYIPPLPTEEVDDGFEALYDLRGVALSGLEGKALHLKSSDFPKAGEVRAALPKDCFRPDTKTSLSYLSVSLIGTAICTAFGIASLRFLPPSNIVTLPFWAAYSGVTGTVAMGLWVLAHECGHGAFSKNKTIQDTVGYLIHSVMLVPYYSWQRSHAVHHKYTNHMELGETHVPEILVSKTEGSWSARNNVVKLFGKKIGLTLWGGLQAFLHLVIGWPAYLMIGASGGEARGLTNHFWPNPLTTPRLPKMELFPGIWKNKVLRSGVGVAASLAAVAGWAKWKGLAQVMALYGGPLLVVNAWLVIYTWLQHTDVDVPHFDMEDHTYVKGALHTIDRPYDKLDPWGLIDFLHHKIGTTHVVHHYDSSIPHYKAEAATEAFKVAFPHLYLYEPTPIFKALWRVCKGCVAVEKRGDRWVWNNEGLEDAL